MKKILFAFACTSILSLTTPALASSPDSGSDSVGANSLTGDEDPGQTRGGGCSAAGFTAPLNVSALTLIFGSAALALALRRRRSV